MAICLPLEAEARAFMEAEARTAMRHLQGWFLDDVDNCLRLSKVYGSDNFLQSLAIAQRVGRLAQAENHHPEIIIAWGRCTVSWWTTRIGGIHDNDVRMAAATDELLSQP